MREIPYAYAAVWTNNYGGPVLVGLSDTLRGVVLLTETQYDQIYAYYKGRLMAVNVPRSVWALPDRDGIWQRGPKPADEVPEHYEP